jgi:hypothetical protein
MMLTIPPMPAQKPAVYQLATESAFICCSPYSVNAVTVAVDPGLVQIKPLIDMDQSLLDADHDIDGFRQLVKFLFDPG